MIVVSNTSPIINLAAVGQLDLLRQLYGQIVIPRAVYIEIVGMGVGQPGADEVATSDWIRTRQVVNRTAVTALQLELDDGEAEAIALAVEASADLLLLDEALGRDIAARFGLRFIGLLGCLVEAKKRELVSSVRPIVDDLIEEASFWIGRPLYERVLQAAGER
jgi:predicted nucleic acid-binding protein